MDFKKAPDTKSQTLEKIGDLFIEKVIGIEDGAMWTDLTLIHDFTSEDFRDADREGSKPGFYIFSFKRYIGPKPFNRESRKEAKNWELVEYEAEGKDVKGDIIRKAEELFGVNITEVYDQYLVEVLTYIVANMSEEIYKKYFV